MNIKEETKCRICGGNLKIVLDLGSIYPSAFLKDDELLSSDSKAPLVLTECEDCNLIQLKHTIDLDLMYRQYWYSSSLNKSMVSSLQDVIRDVQSKVFLKTNDIVLDIGCNDGTMLGMYPKNVRTIGFDPALNIMRSSGSEIIVDYFNANAYRKIPDIKKARIITAIAMFYDLPDPHQFVEDVSEILADDGIFVVQFTDLVSMIKATAFDNICHEHLEYYSLHDVFHLLEAHGLDVIDVSYNDVNGGSLRVTAGHQGKWLPNDVVRMHMKAETDYLKTNDINSFKNKIEITKFKIREFLSWTAFHNKEIYILGASTKGNTLLQVCEITDKNIPFAAEVNKEKFGLRTAGSNIKIISEIDALIKHPDYFLVPVWHFKTSILSNSKIRDYLLSGGRLIFPLPYFHVIYADYSKNIQEVRI